MAATETLRIPLGFKAPDFRLLDTVTDAPLSLNELKGEIATVNLQSLSIRKTCKPTIGQLSE